VEGRPEGRLAQDPRSHPEHPQRETARSLTDRELHREELNALEIAQAYQRLIDEHGYAQNELADKVGKDRSSVTNYLRLLKLPAEIQDRLNDGELSMGHARAMLALEDAATQLYCCRQVIDRGLSVRNTEALVNRLKKKAPRAQRSLADPDLHALQEEMLKVLGTKVLVAGNRNKGVLKIYYFSLDDLNRIYDRIKGASADGNADMNRADYDRLGYDDWSLTEARLSDSHRRGSGRSDRHQVGRSSSRGVGSPRPSDRGPQQGPYRALLTDACRQKAI
jgi:hypothetical protein